MSTDGLRMKRKIQELGSSTLAVTLPAEWAREQRLEKGDQLVVQRGEVSGSLTVVPESQRATGDGVTVDATGLDAEAVERAVRSQYVLGRQLIEIESDGPLAPSLCGAVADVEGELMGVGIVHEDVDSVSIRCSVAPDDFELPSLLERLWRTEEAVRSDAVTALVESDLDAAERATARHRQLETLFYLFLRLLFTTYRNPRLDRSVGLETGFRLVGYRAVAQDLALMARTACQITDHVEEADGPDLDPETRDRLAAVADALDRVATTTQRAVTDPDVEAVEAGRDALDAFEEHAAAAQSHLESARPEPLLVLQRILTALESSAGHAEDSLQVATRFASRSRVAADDR